MSDPVSNHDIEDVLSSIRRLVAQGNPKPVQPAANAPTQLHPTRPVTPAKQEMDEDTGPIERLVLTPAFRVPEPQEDIVPAPPVAAAETLKSFDAAVVDPESDSIPTKDPRPLPGPAQSPSERESLEATIAQLEAAVSNRTDEWEPDGSEVAKTATFASVFMAASATQDRRDEHTFGARVDVAIDADEAVDAHPDADADAEIDADADGTIDAVAEMGAHANATDDNDAEIDTQPDAEINASEDALTAAVADHIADTVADELQDAFPHLQAADDAHHLDDFGVSHFETVQTVIEDAQTDAPEFVDALDVEIEAARAETPTFRHGAFHEVYDPVAEATADAAEAAPDAGDLYGDELAPDPDAHVTGSAVAEPVNTPLMDPDMLRDMVGMMIREELQGEMGERITRNVRKLVRREINRVISAQDFD